MSMIILIVFIETQLWENTQIVYNKRFKVTCNLIIYIKITTKNTTYILITALIDSTSPSKYFTL